MLRGQQRRVVTSGKNKKFYLAGALDVRSGRLHTTGADRKNASLLCNLLRLLASTYRAARRMHVVLDNYSIHHAKLTKRDACRARRPHRAALPAAVLSRREPHRACLAGTARERDAQPSLQDAPGTTDGLPSIRRELPLAHRSDAGAVIGRGMIDGRGSRSVI